MRHDVTPTAGQHGAGVGIAGESHEPGRTAAERSGEQPTRSRRSRGAAGEAGASATNAKTDGGASRNRRTAAGEGKARSTRGRATAKAGDESVDAPVSQPESEPQIQPDRPTPAEPVVPTGPERPEPRHIPAAPRLAARVGDEIRIVASAIFVGGTAPLLPGARYSIGAHEGQMQILGPVDAHPGRVVLSRSLRDIEVSGINGRVVIGERQSVGGGGRLGLVFTGLVGCAIEDLERILVEFGDRSEIESVTFER